MDNYDGFNDGYDNFYDDGHGRTDPGFELMLSFCKACDNNQRFSGDDEDLEVVIENLMEQFSLYWRQETDSYLKKAISFALKTYPDITVFKVWNIRYLFLTKKTDAAKAYFNTVISDSPSDVELYEEMAASAYEYNLEDIDADSLARKAIAIEPTAQMYTLRTKISLDKGDVSKAFDYFQEALDIDGSVIEFIDDITISRHFLGFDSLGAEKLHNGKLIAKIDVDNTEEQGVSIKIPDTDMLFLEKLSDTYPLDFRVWRSVGNAHMFRKEYAKAIEAFQFSISANENPQSYISLCQAYISVKEYDKTVEYAKYINEHFDNLSANVIIGTARRCQGRYQEALSHLCEADQTDFNFPILIPEIVMTLDEAGKVDELPAYFARISDKIKLNIQDSNFLMEVFSDLQSLESFKFVCANARSLFNEDHSYCAYLTMSAYDLDMKGDFLPFEFVSECLENPRDDESFEHLGYFMAILHMLDNNPAQAEYHLRNALVINEENIFEDFFDIDEKKLYAQYQNIFDLVYPYL